MSAKSWWQTQKGPGWYPASSDLRKGAGTHPFAANGPAAVGMTHFVVRSGGGPGFLPVRFLQFRNIELLHLEKRFSHPRNFLLITVA